MPIQTAVLEVVRDLVSGTHQIVVRTPDGEARWPIGTVIPNGEIYTTYAPNPEPKLKKISAKKNKRASIAQERDIMEQLGGRRQAGSGAVGHLKGDGRVRDKYRVEIKYTRTKSYSVTRDELSKIRGECSATEEPLFVVDFVDPETGGSEDRWVLVPFHYFKKLDNLHNAATDHRGPEPKRGRAQSSARPSKQTR
jgi:hypothetical protein